MQDEERVIEILAAWREQRERGEAPEPEDVVRRNPELAECLRQGFAAVALLDRAVAQPALPSAAGAPPEERSVFALPMTLGDFRLLKEIGRGGVGVVYEAEQVTMRRRVALKVLYPSVTQQPKAVERFRREAQAAGRLHHTNIVSVYGMGSEAGTWFYAMDLVEGRSLAHVLSDLRHLMGTPREPNAAETVSGITTGGGRREEFARIARSFGALADALATAHAAGVIHRDVKPSNILLDTTGTLRLVDFGLARVHEEGMGVTATGDIVGTPAYMSPEQARAGVVDARTDVYSLGATLYEVLARRPPFEGRDIAEVLRQVLSADVTPPRRLNPRIPRDLETIVLKAMEKDPSRRYRSAGDLALDLRRFGEGGSIQARRIGPAGRLWRWVRRHKGRSVLVVLLLLALGSGATLAWLLAHEAAQRRHEEARRRDLEYVQLCALAEETSRQLGEHATGRRSFDLFSRAIETLPERYEAFLGRMLSEYGSWTDALADAEAAGARGAPTRAVHLARATALRGLHRAADAAAEERAAAALPGDDPYSTFFESQIAWLQGDVGRALPLLDQVIGSPDARSSTRYLARRTRSYLRAEQGDPAGALEDLHVLRDAGDASPELVVRTAALWRRLGQPGKADALLSDLALRQEAGGSLEGAIALTQHLSAAQEWQWLERFAAAAGARFPDDPALLAGRGWALANTNRLDEAAGLAEKAVGLDPRLHGGQSLLGLVHKRRKELKAAVEPLRKAVHLETSCWGCPVMLCDVLRGLGRRAEALALAEESIRRGPRHPETHEARGLILWELDQPREALECYDRALELRPGHGPALLGRAMSLHKLDRIEDALTAYDVALAVAPESAEAHGRRGYALYHAKRFSDALDALSQAIRLDPTWAFAYGKRALVSEELDDWGGAERDLSKAAELDPGTDEYPFNLGWICLRANRPAEALEWMEKARALVPEDSVALAHRATALALLGKHADSVGVAERALGLDDASVHAHWQRALSLAPMGRLDESAEALSAAVRLDSPDRGEVSFLSDLFHRSQAAALLAAYGAAIDRGLDDPAILNDTAWWLAAKPSRDPADYSRAVSLAETVVAKLPEVWAVWSTLGCARLRAGDFRGAVEALERCMRLRKASAPTEALLLAMAHHHLDNAEEARRWYEEAGPPGDAPGGQDEVAAGIRREAETLLGIAPVLGPRAK